MRRMIDPEIDGEFILFTIQRFTIKIYTYSFIVFINLISSIWKRLLKKFCDTNSLYFHFENNLSLYLGDIGNCLNGLLTLYVPPSLLWAWLYIIWVSASLPSQNIIPWGSRGGWAWRDSWDGKGGQVVLTDGNVWNLSEHNLVPRYYGKLIYTAML